ncbi:MAG TPA: antibiotic biosynthesis monooxygenase [Sphingomicrobium sp.]
MKTEIDDSADIFTLINSFRKSPENQGKVVESLRRFTEDFARSRSGFVAAAVHASTDGSRVVNYVQWRSADDLRSMLAMPEAQSHIAEVGSLAKAVDPVSYKVAFVGRSR